MTDFRLEYFDHPRLHTISVLVVSFPYFPSTSYRGNFCLSTVLLFHAERVTQIMYICWVYHVNDSIVAQSNGFVFFCRLVIPTCGTLCQCETLLQPYHPFFFCWKLRLSVYFNGRKLRRPEWNLKYFQLQLFPVPFSSRTKMCISSFKRMRMVCLG